MKVYSKNTKLFCLCLLLAVFSSFMLAAESPELLFKSGVTAFEKKYYESAVKSLSGLVADYPEFYQIDQAVYLLGLAYFYLRQYTACINTLAKFQTKYTLSALLKDVSYWLGASYYNLGKYPQALPFLQQQAADGQHTYYSQAAYLLGLALQKTGDYHGALAVFSQLHIASSTGSSSPAFLANVLFQLGNSEYVLKNYTEALAYFKKLLLAHSASPLAFDASFYIAECHFLLGEYPEAEKRFTSVLEIFPQSIYRETTLYRLADLMFKAEKYAPALEFIRLLEAEYPVGQYTAALTKIKAPLLFRLEMYREAITEYTKLVGSSSSADLPAYRYNLGLAYQYLGQFREAASWFELAARGEEGQIIRNSLLKLSEVRLELGEDAEAIAILEEYKARYPRSDGLEEVLRSLGLSYMKTGELKQATTTWDRLLREYSSSLYRDEYLFRRASVHIQLQNHKDALIDLNKLIQLYPDSLFFYEAYYNIGYIYSLRNEYVRSFEYFDFVLNTEIAGDLWQRTILAKAISYYNLGDFTPAINGFRQLTALSGESRWQGMAFFYLGKTQLRASKLDAAQADFSRAALFLSGEPEGAEALYWQGWTEFRLNWLTAATGTFEAVVSRYPEHERVVECLFRAGLCYSLLEQYTASNLWLNRAQESLGSSPSNRLLGDVLYQKGLNFLRLNQPKLAEISFLRLHANFPDSELAAEGFFQLAQTAFLAEDWKQAQTYYLKIRQDFPHSLHMAQALMQTAQIHLYLAEYPQAIELFLRYLTMFPTGSLSEAAFTGIKDTFTAMQEPAAVRMFYQHSMQDPALTAGIKNIIKFEYAHWLSLEDWPAAYLLLDELRLAGVGEPLQSKVNLLIGHYFRWNKNYERAFYIYKGIAGGNSGLSGAQAALNAALVLQEMNRLEEAFEGFLEVSFIFPDYREQVRAALEQALQLTKKLDKEAEAIKLKKQLLELN